MNNDSVSVSVDDRPTCYGVHYECSPAEATAHFESRGFRDIGPIVKLDSDCNCNDARRSAVAIAKRQNKTWFFEGQWDYSAGRCAIYEFTYGGYVGATRKGSEGDYAWFAGRA